MSADRPAIDEPRYLTVIPLIARIASTYFAVVAVALVADLLIVQGATFRTWPAFGAQAVLALVVGWFVVRRGLPLALLAAGVLAGGFFPDSLGYSRRAPEPFVRTLLAIVPAAIAAWMLVRSAAPGPVAASTPALERQEPPLIGSAREAATKALELLTACDDALIAFDRSTGREGPPTKADMDRLWATLDGCEVHLRKLPVGQQVSNALQDAAVAYVDAATLTGLALGAHAAMQYSAETAGRFIDEVASRRGVTSGDAAQVATVARTAARAHRARAAELLHASRFGT